MKYRHILPTLGGKWIHNTNKAKQQINKQTGGKYYSIRKVKVQLAREEPE